MVLEFREGLQSLQLAHRNWFDFCDLFCCDFNYVLPVCAGQRTTYSIDIPLFCDLSYWDKNECCPRYCYLVVKTSCLTAEANSCPPFPVLEDMPLLTQLLWTFLSQLSPVLGPKLIHPSAHNCEGFWVVVSWVVFSCKEPLKHCPCFHEACIWVGEDRNKKFLNTLR